MSDNETYTLRQIAAFESVEIDTVIQLAEETMKSIFEWGKNNGYGDMAFAGLAALTKFAEFYNEVANKLITNSSINRFLNNAKLSPFAQVIRIKFAAYAKPEIVLNSKLRTHFRLMFYVNKNLYDRYKATGTLSARFISKSTAPLGLNDAIKLSGVKTRVRIKSVHPCWKRFIQGIERANDKTDIRITQQQAIVAALNMYMDANPDVFAPKETVIDESIIRKRETKTKTGKCRISVAPETHNRIITAMQRYNLLNGSGYTIERFYTIAVNFFLSKGLPLQYTNPRAFLELEKLNAENKNDMSYGDQQ